MMSPSAFFTRRMPKYPLLGCGDLELGVLQSLFMLLLIVGGRYGVLEPILMHVYFLVSDKNFLYFLNGFVSDIDLVVLGTTVLDSILESKLMYNSALYININSSLISCDFSENNPAREGAVNHSMFVDIQSFSGILSAM